MQKKQKKNQKDLKYNFIDKKTKKVYNISINKNKIRSYYEKL